MDRREFMKLLGMGAAAAVVAPQVLAQENKHTMGVDTAIGDDITSVVAMGPDGVYHGAMSVGKSCFVYVKVASTTIPFRLGDLIRYKVNKKGETIAYRSNRLSDNGGEFGVAINNVVPGNYTFIKIAGSSMEVTRLADGSPSGDK